MIMIQYSLFHSEEFENPKWAFCLGIYIVLVNMACGMTNTLQTLTRTTIEDVISKYVAFKLLI